MSMSVDDVEDDSPEAVEGEAVHWLIETALKGGSLAGLHQAPNGVVLTREMYECAEVMIDDVGETSGLHVEELLQIHSIHDLCEGTPDAWRFDADEQHITLWDYKHGHKDVPADSWQNVCYVAGVLDKVGANGYEEQQIRITMKIVQPRCFTSDGPIKEYTCTASDLRARFNILIHQAAKALEPEPGVKSGDHCRYCPARHSCGAARKAAYAAVDYADSALPETMTPDAISFEIGLLTRAAEAIKHRMTGIEGLALAKANQGQLIPGYIVENGKGKRRFTVELDELAVLGELVGVDMTATPKAITPAEFDRRIKRVNTGRKLNNLDPIDTSVINTYIETPDTGQKLKRSDDSRVIKAFKKT